jgi:hypothetical protein
MTIIVAVISAQKVPIYVRRRLSVLKKAANVMAMGTANYTVIEGTGVRNVA